MQGSPPAHHSGMHWHQEEIVLDGRRLSWRRARTGAGPPLVYLHDAGADTLASPAFADLAADHDVVLVDLPGYGRSDHPAGLGSAVELGRVLGDLVGALGVGPVTLAGTSLGGWFAAETALAAPEHIAALLLADAAGLQIPQDYLFDLYLHTGGPSPVAPVADVAAAAAVSWDPHCANPILLRRLGSIACPTLVLWGELDSLIPLAHGRAFAAAIPGSRLSVYRGAGHLLALEDPAAFAAAVRSLTRRHRPGRDHAPQE